MDRRIEEAVKAYQSCRSKRQAARELGIAESTLRGRLKAAEKQGHLRTGKRKEKQRAEDLIKIIERMEESIERLRARPTINKHKARVKRHKGDETYCRVIIPDSHGSAIDEDARDAFIEDLVLLDPEEIVMLGDHIDCGGFLAQHHTIGYVAESAYTFEEDIECANDFLDMISTAAPNAVIHYLEGNHERRIQRWCTTQALSNPRDSQYLHNLFSIPKLLGLKKRGIKFYAEDQMHHKMHVRGTIKLGKCHFTHGSTASKHAAATMCGLFGDNVVFGHTHRADTFITKNASLGVYGAWNPGCLCALQPYYGRSNVTGWSHGYAFQYVQQDNGRFWHSNVPIVNGESMLPKAVFSN